MALSSIVLISSHVSSWTKFGQGESVSRGQPSGGFTFCHDFCSGSSDHFGVNAGFGLMRFRVSNATQAPFAAYDRPFSTYLIGLCMPEAYLQVLTKSGLFSELAVFGGERAPGRRQLAAASDCHLSSIRHRPCSHP